jgi:hypothetical protein
VSDSEIRNLCDRLLARANSILPKDQPEQQRDLRLAAQFARATNQPRQTVNMAELTRAAR